MGCGVSRIDANGLSIPVKLRPLFLSRLEEISKSRHGRPLKDSTPSKKELLFHEKDDDDYDHVLKTAPSSPKDTVADGTKIEDTKRIEQENEGGVITSLGKRDDNEHEVSRKSSTKGNCKDVMKESMIEHMEAKEKDRLDNMLTDTENEDDDDDDHIERMICHETDDDAFPGSPSFRVYFNDNEEDDHHDNGNRDALKDTTSIIDTSSSKESSEKQKVKRGKKRRSFKLPKGGQVKNLLNVKSCYMPSHSAPHDRAHLLPPPKTTT
ncbi:uncharacterized protein LOC142548189 isoform X1 [Primulina tabacum]|uniref:uncharacterized protein LOC142548189 isoform X1 n=1 Tax=Primulina tabacum TaxID=48773 RepID=UPI003F59A790